MLLLNIAYFSITKLYKMVLQILHIFPLQICTIFGHLNIAYFSLTNLYNIWSSKSCIFFPYKFVQYSVVRILHIFPLQSCTIFGHPNIAYFSITKLYKMVLQILHIFPLQSCTIFGHLNTSSIFCLLNEVDYTCYRQHIIILFVCYFVNSFISALIIHREY